MTMKRKWGRRAGAALVIGLTVTGIAAVSVATRPSDQAQLEAMVVRVEEGFETKSAGAVMSAVASNYHDPEGLDREDVSRIVHRLARGRHSVDITISKQQIEVDGDRASGHFDVLAVVTEGSERINWPMRLEVEFARTPPTWWRPWHREWVVQSVGGHGMSSWLDAL